MMLLYSAYSSDRRGREWAAVSLFDIGESRLSGAIIGDYPGMCTRRVDDLKRQHSVAIDGNLICMLCPRSWNVLVFQALAIYIVALLWPK